MAKWILVKLSDGSQGKPPAGWPMEVTTPFEAPSQPGVSPGYTEAWPEERLAERKAQLQSAYNTWFAGTRIPPEVQRRTALVDLADRDVVQALTRLLFNHTNRILALEGKSPITKSQFRTQLMNLMD